jgi:hypothetical protein
MASSSLTMASRVAAPLTASATRCTRLLGMQTTLMRGRPAGRRQVHIIHGELQHRLVDESLMAQGRAPAISASGTAGLSIWIC